MESNNTTTTIGCISPLSVLIFLVFFCAKIFDKIDWSWWWVFSPLWIPASIALAILLFCGIAWIVLTLIDTWK